MAVLYRFLPSPPLSTYIASFCFYEGEAESSGKERCLPSGQTEVVINLGHDTIRVAGRAHDDLFQSFHGGVLHGAFSEYSILDMTTLVSTIQICFKPGGAAPFLPMPAAALTNQVVDLSVLWGSAAALLREQLQMARTREERVCILERFLLARLTWEQTPHPAVPFALAAFQDGRSISEVTAQLGLFPRRFIHLFREAVGLTPKTFCRVQRFQDVLRQTKRGHQVHWTDLAITCGYFDQAHFIHDFQSFAGLTPGAYLMQRSEFHNHVPLPD